MDLIVILTKDSYYVAYYDDEVDKVMNYQRVALSDIEIIEFGVAPHSVSTIWISVSFIYSVITGSEFEINKKVSKIWTKIEPPKKSKLGMGMAKGGFFSESAIRFSNLQISKKPYSKKLSWPSNFKFPPFS